MGRHLGDFRRNPGAGIIYFNFYGSNGHEELSFSVPRKRKHRHVRKEVRARGEDRGNAPFVLPLLDALLVCALIGAAEA